MKSAFYMNITANYNKMELLVRFTWHDVKKFIESSISQGLLLEFERGE